MQLLFILCLALSTLLISCSKKVVELKKNPVFYGECQVRVVSKIPEASIEIDGVVAGKSDIFVNTPCGEKQITVRKHGFKTHQEYTVVSNKNALNVSVELEKLAEHENFALSKELIEQIKEGKAPKDPAIAKAEAEKAAKEKPKAGASSPESTEENWN